MIISLSSLVAPDIFAMPTTATGAASGDKVGVMTTLSVLVDSCARTTMIMSWKLSLVTHIFRGYMRHTRGDIFISFSWIMLHQNCGSRAILNFFKRTTPIWCELLKCFTWLCKPEKVAAIVCRGPAGNNGNVAFEVVRITKKHQCFVYSASNYGLSIQSQQCKRGSDTVSVKYHIQTVFVIRPWHIACYKIRVCSRCFADLNAFHWIQISDFDSISLQEFKLTVK